MKYLKFFEELNHDTYMNASSKLNNLGYNTRAVDISYHGWETYFKNNNYSEKDIVELNIKGKIYKTYPLVLYLDQWQDLTVLVGEKILIQIYFFFLDKEDYLNYKIDTNYSGIIDFILYDLRINKAYIMENKDDLYALDGFIKNPEVLYQYIIDVYSNKRKQISLFSMNDYEYDQTGEEISKLIVDIFTKIPSEQIGGRGSRNKIMFKGYL